MSDAMEKELLSSAGQQERVGRSVGIFSVAVFAVSGTEEKGSFELAGTGTLVMVKDSFYLQTANHVWHKHLKKSDGVGLALKEGVDHRFFMRTDTLTAYELPRPEEWGEWGPDAVFVRIPLEYVRKIHVYRAFYRLDKERKLSPECRLAVRIIVGTPAVFAERTVRHVNAEVNALFVQADSKFELHGEYDYIDFDMDTSLPGVAKDFGGVSGGGLWDVGIYQDETTGKFETVEILVGVAFHQKATENGHIIVRCHGPKTLQALMAIPTQAKLF